MRVDSSETQSAMEVCDDDGVSAFLLEANSERAKVGIR